MRFKEWLLATESRVDPYHLNRWGYNTDVRQQCVLYCLASPGKQAWTTARSVWLFLARNPGDTPFQKVIARTEGFDPNHPVRQNKTVGVLADELSRCGFGDYNALAASWAYAARNVNVDDPKSLSVANLVRIPRCNAKTARLIVENLVPCEQRVEEDRRIAILDVHILRWLREVMGFKDCPETAPQSDKQYRHWETIWNQLRDEGKTGDDLTQWRGLASRPPADWRSRPISRKTGGRKRAQWHSWDGTVLRRHAGSWMTAQGNLPWTPSEPPGPEDGQPWDPVGFLKSS